MLKVALTAHKYATSCAAHQLATFWPRQCCTFNPGMLMIPLHYIFVVRCSRWWMWFVVSLSAMSISTSVPPARRGSKQVGEERLSGERQMSLRPCTPSRGPRTSSFITHSGTLTALDCLSQVFSLCAMLMKQLVIFFLSHKTRGSCY